MNELHTPHHYMQLLNDENWRCILKEQQDQQVKTQRTHVIILNPQGNVYQLFDFAKIEKQNEPWYGFHVDSFQNVEKLGSLQVWQIDTKTDIKQVFDVISKFLNIQKDRFDENMCILTFLNKQQNFEDTLGKHAQLLQLFKQNNIQSQNSQQHTYFAQQAHQQQSLQQNNVNHKNTNITINIPSVIINQLQLDQFQTLLLRKYASQHYSSIINDINSQYQKQLIIFAVNNKYIQINAEHIISKTSDSFRISGQDDYQVINQLIQELKQNENIKEQPIQHVIKQEKVQVFDNYQQFIENLNINFCKAVIQQATSSEQNNGGETGIGSRYKRKQQGSVFK